MISGLLQSVSGDRRPFGDRHPLHSHHIGFVAKGRSAQTGRFAESSRHGAHGKQSAATDGWAAAWPERSLTARL
jgi:hypothetical protein